MKNGGFTLIELVVTIAILSIVLSITIPKISIDFGYMDKMANEFVMDVRYIQIENMKNPSQNYKIRIYEDIGKYTVNNSDVVEKVVTFKEKYIIRYSNIGSIGFNGEGTPVNAGTFTIINTITNETKNVSIVPTTGRTIIKE
jgi:prepilin-type N-terminal cleavage/methylation domain-containing protein